MQSPLGLSQEAGICSLQMCSEREICIREKNSCLTGRSVLNHTAGGAALQGEGALWDGFV